MILPYCILPEVRWFVIGCKQPQFRILKNAPFTKQHGFNRYAIGGPNSIQNLSVPLHQNDRNLPLTAVRINYSENWVKDHKNAWQTAYGKSPFFEYYDYRFWQILDDKPQTMGDLIEGFNEVLFNNLKISHPPLYKNEVGAEKSIITEQLLKPYEHTLELLTTPGYPQVFETKFGFRSPLSAIDLLFNLGPLAVDYFSKSQNNTHHTPPA